MKKTLDTDAALLTYEDDILFVKIKADVTLDQEDMEKLLHQAIDFTSANKHFAIIDTTSHCHSTPEARNFYAESDFSKYRYADAFIVNSLPMRMLVNFFISFNKPKIHSKMFNSEESALIWIKSLKKEMLKVHKE